ncbi:hypothetical protein JCM3765_005033 [Sporobolomyces pararoseus]
MEVIAEENLQSRQGQLEQDSHSGAADLQERLHRLNLISNHPNLPRLPPDIIYSVADEFERTCTTAECRKIGCRMSLVCREWREIGQSLVFRHVFLPSVDVYSPMVRRLVQRSFFLVEHIRHIGIKHLTPTIPTATVLLPMFNSCFQLSRLTISTMPKQMSEIIKALVNSTARKSVKRIQLDYVLSGSLDDFDDRDFLKLGEINLLEVFSVTVPVDFIFLLPRRFPASQPLRTQGFYLRFSGKTQEEDYDAATSSFLSLIEPRTLRHLFLSTPSIPPSAAKWLAHQASLKTLHLLNDHSLVSRTISNLVPVVNTLRLLRSLKIEATRLPCQDEITNDILVFEPTMVELLHFLPTWITVVSLDAITTGGGYRAITDFLRARQSGALCEFKIMGGKGERIVARKVVKEGRSSWKVDQL